MRGGLKRAFLLKVVYPAFMLAGSFFKGRKDALLAHVIKLNNRFVLREGFRVKKLLLLLPHCLQVDKCRIRLTHNIRNCEGCGQCGIRDLIEIADSGGIDIFVATGGNLARRIVADLAPDAVVAVACERDLASGIADSYPVPVLGVYNERPFGPCLNTRVDMALVREAIGRLSARTA